MLLNIILSDFQQYRTLLAKVIQFFVSPEKCENQRYEVLTPDLRYIVCTQKKPRNEVEQPTYLPTYLPARPPAQFYAENLFFYLDLCVSISTFLFCRDITEVISTVIRHRQIPSTVIDSILHNILLYNIKTRLVSLQCFIVYNIFEP